MKELRFQRWVQFREWLDDDRQILPVYWRGQRYSKWPLASTFERTVLSWGGGGKPEAAQVYPYDGRYVREGKPVWKRGFYQAMRDRYMDAFKGAAVAFGEQHQLNLTQINGGL